MEKDPKYYFQISTASGVPIYRQIVDQVKTLIATNQWQPGVFIPSVRNVSKALEVNPMTVSKAYSLLEKEGVLQSVRGRGMQVATVKSATNDLRDRQEEIGPLIDQVIDRARQLSLDYQQLQDLITKAWEDKDDE